MSCQDCRFWERDQEYKPYGCCKRFPPQGVDLGRSFFPAIQEDGWCGEFKKSNQK